MNQINLDSSDVGVIIRATITFVDFDPTGADCHLGYTGLVSRTKHRPMAFDGVSVATYTVQEGDFDPGVYTAFVRVVKGAVRIDSEAFAIVVT